MFLIRTLLTKREVFDLFEIVQNALTVQTDEEIKALLLRIQEIVPCDYAIACLGRTDLDKLSEGGIKIINASYPADWLTFYMNERFCDVDPILQFQMKCFKTRAWSEKECEEFISTSPKYFSAHKRTLKVSQEVTASMPCVRRSIGSFFSFSGRSIASHSRHTAVIDAIVPHLHIAMMRSIFPQPAFSNSLLSFREKEALNWVKEGKTNWEISQILDISERTVKFHMQNIFKKLNASTRSQAVALAMAQGIVTL